ncbi:hypothetical protein F5890DRAFT_1481226 [Lentinula detonsa]|uniref:Uncharacterized protein n=1 Tax=Lentinula detonsa TaxID=2804962 RepID=A0AA38QBD7_9AGAR|nr:hypothetical protein F5890DRAFT_1481226 [Lentinula detonsa]
MTSCQFCRQCTCRVRDTEPRLYQWESERPESPTSSVPSLSTCGSSSTASSPAPSFSPSSVKSMYSTKAQRLGSKPAKAHQVQKMDRPDSHHPTVDDFIVRRDKLKPQTSMSAFEPRVRTRTLNGDFIRYPVTDENHKLEYYMQRTGSHPTQSLQSKPNVISSYRQTGPKLSSKLNRRTTVNPISSFEMNPAHDPRDWMVEKTTRWTIRRDDIEAIEKSSPSLDSKNSTRTPEPPRPLGFNSTFLSALSYMFYEICLVCTCMELYAIYTQMETFGALSGM